MMTRPTTNQRGMERGERRTERDERAPRGGGDLRSGLPFPNRFKQERTMIRRRKRDFKHRNKQAYQFNKSREHGVGGSTAKTAAERVATLNKETHETDTASKAINYVMQIMKT